MAVICSYISYFSVFTCVCRARDCTHAIVRKRNRKEIRLLIYFDFYFPFPAVQHIFLFKINENDFSLLWLENGFAFRPHLENVSCLKNSIMEC